MADLEMEDVLGHGMTGTVYEALCVSLLLLPSASRPVTFPSACATLMLCRRVQTLRLVGSTV